MADGTLFTFTIKETDEETGEVYTGQFKSKMRLSWNEQLRQDEIRRGLLGDKSPDAAVRVNNMADMLAFLQIHLTEWPKWWSDELKFGQECSGDTVPLAIWQAIIDEKNRRKAEKSKAAEAAAKDIIAVHQEPAAK